MWRPQSFSKKSTQVFVHEAPALACQFVGWLEIKTAESNPAGNGEADPSRDWEAQLVADDHEDLVWLLEGDQHRPLLAQLLQELIKEKLSKQAAKHY